MLIDFRKLKNMGYKVDWNEKSQTVGIYPTSHNHDAQRALHEVADMLEFNNSEQDDLIVACQNIQELKALKVAMGW